MRLFHVFLTDPPEAPVSDWTQPIVQPGCSHEDAAIAVILRHFRAVAFIRGTIAAHVIAADCPRHPTGVPRFVRKIVAEFSGTEVNV